MSRYAALAALVASSDSRRLRLLHTRPAPSPSTRDRPEPIPATGDQIEWADKTVSTLAELTAIHARRLQRELTITYRDRMGVYL